MHTHSGDSEDLVQKAGFDRGRRGRWNFERSGWRNRAQVGVVAGARNQGPEGGATLATGLSASREGTHARQREERCLERLSLH